MVQGMKKMEVLILEDGAELKKTQQHCQNSVEVSNPGFAVTLICSAVPASLPALPYSHTPNLGSGATGDQAKGFRAFTRESDFNSSLGNLL